MASTTLFGRRWKIVLNTMSDDGTTILKTKSLTGLKVTFKVVNTLLGDPSLGTFQIYNVNKDTESMLTAYNCHISFYAGYHTDSESEWSVLFSGEVTNSYSLRQQTDVVWNVWARDSFKILNSTRPSITSIQNPTSPKVLLERLTADAIGVTGTPTYINGCDSVLSSADDVDDLNITGTFKEEFDDLLHNYGLGWQVQNGEFVVYDQTNTDPETTNGSTIEVSNNTGLLTIPTVDYTGVKFSHLLSGQFKPSKIISVEPNTIKYNLGNEFYVKKYDKELWRASGLFRIYEVTHEGDTRGDKWETNIIAFYRRNS